MPIRYVIAKNFDNKKLNNNDLVVEISGGSPTQSTGRITIITNELLDRYERSLICTNFCRALKPKNGYGMFIYFYWQYLYDKNAFFCYENGTTGIKNLDLGGFLTNEEIIIPPIDLILKFDEQCQFIFRKIFTNGYQNEQLSILLNTLLPKLLKGDIDLSNI